MTRSDKRKIDPAIKLPCDFIVGHIRFGKGVKLETVRMAAERWLKEAIEADKPKALTLPSTLRETPS